MVAAGVLLVVGVVEVELVVGVAEVVGIADVVITVELVEDEVEDEMETVVWMNSAALTERLVLVVVAQAPKGAPSAHL